jgi:oligoribonuclease
MKLPTKLLWIDLELTGLVPEKDVILEVGAILTDFSFSELDSYEAVIHQPNRKLNTMKKANWYDWKNNKRVIGSVYDQHEKSGLLEKVRSSKITEADAEDVLIRMLKKHNAIPGYIAGNSIHLDRRFIRTRWPRLEAELHYRMLDVSSFKIWMQGAKGVSFMSKNSNHRALDDIRGSVSELKYYLELFKNEPKRR